MTKRKEEGVTECDKCDCKPCQCKRIEKARKSGSKTCHSCECDLGLRGGYGGTDLCGPCCTGESATLEEKFKEW